MSWLFKSLQSDGPDLPPPERQNNTPTTRNGGVKDDLSVIGETIGRQLRGVAAFLAPPPITTEQRRQPQSPPQSPDSPSSQTLLGIRNDLVEIGGSFKSGLSILSSNKAVTGISKFASNLLQFQNQDDDGDFDGVAGITQEVVEFVKEISQRAECWTDFPLSLDDDIEMSDAQREHISSVEHLVPSLRDLRINLHRYLGDDQFWMIYFILLLPRVNEHDFELLSTPQIIETRNILLQKLHDKKTAQADNSSTNASQTGSNIFETQGENIQSGEKEIITEIVSEAQVLEIDDEENTERWLDDAEIDNGISVDSRQKIEHDEDVSFSDLEDDGNDLPSRLSASRPGRDVKATSPCGSNDWVKLNDSSENRGDPEKARQSISRDKDSEGESSDWLAIDDFD